MSIDVNVQNDLVIVTESSEDITVNVSNAAGPAGANGVGVPVGGTTGQVLKKFTNSDFDTYWAADASGLTSVGLSMPSAFTVSNTPLTTNGTIAVSGAGTASQYVRGDGQLANFPTSGGGGSSVNYYLNGSVNQGTFGGDTYYEMSKTPIIGTGTNFTRTNAQGNGYIASFITDAGDPALLNIPGGNWNLEFYFAASSSGGTPSFYAELYKVSSSNVFTLIASGSTNPEGITQGTVIDQYFTSIAVPQTSLLVTDRLAIRIFVTPSGRTITLHTEDNNLCEVLTTFSTGLNALNGLTSQVQYFATGASGTDFAISSATDTHTFNLPTASATNRGALSSADWSTFNNKVPPSRTLTINGTAFDLSADRSWTIATGLGGSLATGQVAFGSGTNTIGGSNNLFWNNTNARLGIGTASPTRPLSITFNANDGNGLLYLNNPNTGSAANAGLVLQATTASGSVFATSSTYSTYGILTANMVGFYANSTFGIAVQSGDFIIGTANELFPKFRLFGNTGNVLIQSGGTFTDAGFRLDVNGTARVSDNLTISKNQNNETQLRISNTTSGASSSANIAIVSSVGIFSLGKYSQTTTAYKIFNASDSFIYNNNLGGDIALLNDTTTGKIKFSAGAVSTAQMTLTAAGRLLLGTVSEGIYILDVNGTPRFSGGATAGAVFGSGTILNLASDAYMFATSTTGKNAGYTANRFSTSEFASFDLISGASFSSGWSIQMQPSQTRLDIVDRVNNSSRMSFFSSGNVIIGGTTDVASAQLQIDSTTKGFLPPRMTTTQKNAIASPATGLMVFDTTLAKLCVYSGTTWETITSI